VYQTENKIYINYINMPRIFNWISTRTPLVYSLYLFSASIIQFYASFVHVKTHALKFTVHLQCFGPIKEGSCASCMHIRSIRCCNPHHCLSEQARNSITAITVLHLLKYNPSALNCATRVTSEKLMSCHYFYGPLKWENNANRNHSNKHLKILRRPKS
jgi:hypothetical protein